MSRILASLAGHVLNSDGAFAVFHGAKWSLSLLSFRCAARRLLKHVLEVPKLGASVISMRKLVFWQTPRETIHVISKLFA